jgi:GWxTD domain-containing protein
MKVKTPAIVCFFLLFLSSITPAQQVKEKDLDPQYRDWLNLTRYIIHDNELDVFMQLGDNRQRDTFIEAFWKLRDPTPGTPKNEFKEEIIERFNYANRRLGSGAGRPGWMTDQGRIYIILGEPVSIERNPSSQDVYPNEIWSYYGDPNLGLPSHFTLVFFRKGGSGELKLYDPVSDGPASLLVLGRHWDFQAYEELYEKIREVSPILALSCLSLVPGDIPLNYQPSPQNNFIMANILESVKKNYNPTYATHFLDLIGVVDTEYMTNFIESEVQTDVIRDPVSGLDFLHFSILPKEMSVDYYEPNNQYYSDLRINVSLSVHDNIIFQYSKDFPVYFSEDEVSQVSSTGLSIEDAFPLATGDYKFTILLQNSVAKEFSIFEQDMSIPEDPGAPKICGPFIGYKILNLSESYHIPYKILDKKLAVDPKKMYAASDELAFFLNIENLTRELWEGGEVRVSVSVFEGQGPPKKSYAIKLNNYPFNETLFIDQTLAASEFVPDYYDLRLSLNDKNGTTIDETNENFIISTADSMAHPNPKTKGVPLQNQFIYYYMLAHQYDNLYRPEKAEEYFEKAYAQRPDYINGLIDYANFALKTRKYDKAIELIEKVRDDEEHKFSYYLIKGKALMGLDSYEEAIDSLLEGNKIYNSDLSLLNSLGFCYYRTDQKERALEVLNTSLRLNPNQEEIKELIKEIEK